MCDRRAERLSLRPCLARLAATSPRASAALSRLPFRTLAEMARQTQVLGSMSGTTPAQDAVQNHPVLLSTWPSLAFYAAFVEPLYDYICYEQTREACCCRTQVCVICSSFAEAVKKGADGRSCRAERRRFSAMTRRSRDISLAVVILCFFSCYMPWKNAGKKAGSCKNNPGNKSIDVSESLCRGAD